METILNLWLAIALAMFGRWAISGTHVRRPENRLLLEAIALVCALALLFPVVSLTDDLHPETAIVDTAIGKKDVCYVIASSLHVMKVTGRQTAHSSHVVGLSADLVQIQMNAVRTTTPSSTVSPSEWYSKLHGRSPPPLF